MAIAASLVGTIAVSAASPQDAGQKDERDRMIFLHGEVVRYYVLSAGVVGTLGLAMAGVERFWISNAIYLAFVLAALVSTTVRLAAYRRGFLPW